MVTHEDFSRSLEFKEAGNGGFGAMLTAAFAIVGLWPLLAGGALRTWAFFAAGAILVITLAAPVLLTAPKRLWLRLGTLLNRIVSPVVLALMFYAVVTPVGLLARICGVDSLRLRPGNHNTYWIDREPPGPKPDSLSNQF